MQIRQIYTQQRYRDSPGAITGVTRWMFSHGCALLYLDKPALTGWYDECKYDKATAFASYMYDLLMQLSTSSAYALSHAVYVSPRRPPKWMWGSSYVSVYNARESNPHLMDAYSTFTAYWHNRCSLRRINRACLLLYTLDLSLNRAFLLRQVMNGLMALVTHLMRVVECLNYNQPLVVIGATF